MAVASGAARGRLLGRAAWCQASSCAKSWHHYHELERKGCYAHVTSWSFFVKPFFCVAENGCAYFEEQKLLCCGLQFEVRVHKAPHHSKGLLSADEAFFFLEQIPDSCETLTLLANANLQWSGSYTLCVLKPLVNRTKLQSSQGLRLVPKTSLSSPPWPELKLPDPIKEAEHHKGIVQKVNELIATGQYGRLFAVVHFASRQWKVTNEDLILIENHIPAECGDRIRMEKVLLVGADDFTLLGKPLLGKDLVRVEATVIEKTEAWPRMYMRFRRKRRFQRKRIIIQPQTVLRINTIEIAPILS